MASTLQVGVVALVSADVDALGEGDLFVLLVVLEVVPVYVFLSLLVLNSVYTVIQVKTNLNIFAFKKYF